MTAFVYLFFIADFFWCLRRSRFVVGARENGLGARLHFLYGAQTLNLCSLGEFLCLFVCLFSSFSLSVRQRGLLRSDAGYVEEKRNEIALFLRRLVSGCCCCSCSAVAATTTTAAAAAATTTM